MKIAFKLFEMHSTRGANIVTKAMMKLLPYV